jgi:hypothetical protein
MISDSAALILFAIRSAVKLTQQIRLAYVDSTRRRELVLPLPKFFTDTDGLGKKYVDGYERDGEAIPADPRLGELLKKAGTTGLSTDEKRELVDLHLKYRNVSRAEEGGWANLYELSNLFTDLKLGRLGLGSLAVGKPLTASFLRTDPDSFSSTTRYWHGMKGHFRKVLLVLTHRSTVLMLSYLHPTRVCLRP